MTVRMLLDFDLPEARRTVLGLFPELRRAITTASTLAYLINNELFDAESRPLAARIATAIWAYVGVVQETRRDDFPVGERLALARLKQATRDVALTVSWPTNSDSGAYHLELDQRAVVALERLRAYDRLQGPSSYVGNMGADVLALADGTTARKAQAA